MDVVQMEFSLTRQSIWALDSNVALIFFSPQATEHIFKGLVDPIRVHIESQLESADFKGECDEIVILFLATELQIKKLILVGLGNKPLSKTKVKRLFNCAARELKQAKSTHCSVSLDALTFLQRDLQNSNQLAEWLCDSLLQAQYDYQLSISEKKCLPQKRNMVVLSCTEEIDSKAIQFGQITSKAVTIAKQLTNLPGNICTPEYLSNAAKLAVDGIDNTNITILSANEIESMGMGAFTAVAKGSVNPGNITIIEYRGAEDQKEPPILLVGKGVTFDSGGISLKARYQMHEMKFDMGGSAAIIGVLYALAAKAIKANIIGVLANAENMPDGKACRPGDVVTSLSGKSIEIIDTDAEGRLLLCDALTYAIQRYVPKLVIDVATLTGSCVVALGEDLTGLFTPNDKLACALTTSGLNVEDPVWRLPLLPEHKHKILSPFADLANIGGRNAGASTAACFISQFTENLPWAHLDTAGVVAKGGASKMATGRPVALLVEFITQYYKTDFT